MEIKISEGDSPAFVSRFSYQVPPKQDQPTRSHLSEIEEFFDPPKGSISELTERALRASLGRLCAAAKGWQYTVTREKLFREDNGSVSKIKKITIELFPKTEETPCEVVRKVIMATSVIAATVAVNLCVQKLLGFW